MDPFKEHIRKHEEQLDSREPPDRVLAAIQARLAPAAPARVATMGRARTWVRWAAAASVIVAVSLGALFLSRRPGPAGNYAARVTAPMQSAPAAPTPSESPKTAAPVVPVVPAGPAEPSVARGSRERPKPHRDRPAEADVLEGIGNFRAVNAMISQQMNEIQAMPVYTGLSSNFVAFKKDLAQLDRDEKDLKQRMRQHGPAPDDVETLINIYQQKIQVLKCLKSEILKTNNHLRRSAMLDSAAHSVHA